MRTTTATIAALTTLAVAGLLGPIRPEPPTAPVPPPTAATAAPPTAVQPRALYTHPPAPAPTATATPLAPPTPTGELEVPFIDTGQGDATLLLAPDATMLIDTGRHDRTDVVDHLAATELEAIDALAITHGHADHLGQFRSSRSSTSPRSGGPVRPTRPRRSTPRSPRSSQATLPTPNPAPATPPPSAACSSRSPTPRPTPTSTTCTRPASSCASPTARSPSCSPATPKPSPRPACSQATPAFLAAVDPTIAIHSADADNPYGHPAQSVLDRLADAGVTVYGTDTHGTIVVTTDGVQVTVTTQRAGAQAIDPTRRRRLGLDRFSVQTG